MAFSIQSHNPSRKKKINIVMYHLTLEMVKFYDSIKTKDFYKIQPWRMPSLGGKNVRVLLTPKCLTEPKVKSKHHIPLSRFVLAIWCHLLTNENKPHRGFQCSNPPVRQLPSPDSRVSPTTSHESLPTTDLSKNFSTSKQSP